jgi:hypothetical protein
MPAPAKIGICMPISGDEARGTSTFYYTMSTWNPYGQVIMKSTIQDNSKQR